MKYLIVGDYHDVPVKGNLDRIIEKEKPDVLVSLGDFDIIESVNEFLEIKEQCKKLGINVIDVSGNHDHAIFNEIEISSSILDSLNTDVSRLHRELEQNPPAKKYFEYLLKPENIIKRLSIGKFNASVMHGAYMGDYHSSSYVPSGSIIDNLWFRLRNMPNFQDNFEFMKKRNENLMIRGHDHAPLHGSLSKGNVSYHFPHDMTIDLNPEELHVVGPGAFCENCYAVLISTLDQLLKVRYQRFEAKLRSLKDFEGKY